MAESSNIYNKFTLNFTWKQNKFLTIVTYIMCLSTSFLYIFNIKNQYKSYLAIYAKSVKWNYFVSFKIQDDVLGISLKPRDIKEVCQSYYGYY